MITLLVTGVKKENNQVNISWKKIFAIFSVSPAFLDHAESYTRTRMENGQYVPTESIPLEFTVIS